MSGGVSMVATVVYIICILIMPKAFMNVGISYVVRDKIQGVWLIMLSKTLWWMAVLHLLVFWFPFWQTYFVAACVLGLTHSILKDKKYVFFETKTLKKVQ